MATITSVGSGAWSSTDTWDSGVPADGDTVVIASGHTVTFDVDQSAFTTGLALVTINGTLTVTLTAGTYALKMANNALVRGAGTFNIGTPADPLHSTVRFTFRSGKIDGQDGLTFTIYGTIGKISTTMTNTETSGATRIEVDDDLTSDGAWAAGSEIWFVDPTNNNNQAGCTISAVAATYIDIVGTVGKTFTAGSLVILYDRNITLISGSTSYVVGTFNYPKLLTIYGARFRYRKAIQAFNVTLEKCLFGDTNTYRVLDGSGFYIKNCAFLGNTGNYSLVDGINYVSDTLFIKNSRIVYKAGGQFRNCMFLETTNPAIDTSIAVFTDCSFNNTTNLSNSDLRLDNCIFLGGTEAVYSSMYELSIIESYDHDQSDGAYKAWTRGGVTASQTSVLPTGYDLAYLMAPESATYPVWWKRTFTVLAGQTINVKVQLRKDASMIYLPRVWLTVADDNPFLDASAIVDSFTMTDTTDTWEDDTFAITNSTDYDQDYKLWFLAKNATGSVYSAYDITTEGGGTSSVKIQPLFGRIGL